MLYGPQAVTLLKDHLFHRYIIFINIVGSHYSLHSSTRSAERLLRSLLSHLTYLRLMETTSRSMFSTNLIYKTFLRMDSYFS